MTVTITGDVKHLSETAVTLTLQVEGLPADCWLHVDDSTDGTFAGTDPTCKECGHRVGYLHSDVPDTMEEAYAAAFIPCIEDKDNNLYCLPCAREGVLGEGDEDEEELA